MKRRRKFGTIHVPGYPPTDITNQAIAVYIMSQEREIERLRGELEKLGKHKPLIVVPGGAIN